MSTAYTLARKRHPMTEPIADNAQWWRLWLNGRNFPDENYAVMVHVDDVDNPQLATITFNDGLDETIAVEAHRTGISEPARLRSARNPLTSLVVGDPYLDLLTVGRPTSFLRWEAITAPGNHHHPDRNSDY